MVNISKNDHLALVFADIVGSSTLYAEKGDEYAKQRIDEAIATMAQTIRRYRGRVIKTIGDEIMFVHSDPEEACEIAMKINHEVLKRGLNLRTGMSFGKVIIEPRDVYGDTVNKAAYLTKAAQANQILLDSDTYANLLVHRYQCDFFDRVIMKGQRQETLIYRLNWEDQDITSLDTTRVANKAVAADLPSQILITYRGTSYIGDISSQLIIGRDHRSAHICVLHKNASRKHCTISYSRGKFILSDLSTNGTYVIQENRQELFLRRESTPLQGKGRISIGQPCQNSEVILEYQLE